jgi:hypothetical protein
MIAIGTKYKNRKGQTCTVTDIHTTTNTAGEVVRVRYVAAHEFCGQNITERDIPETTILRALDQNPIN